jgi:putative nucleotidyltransferase with HDIG domain
MADGIPDDDVPDSRIIAAASQLGAFGTGAASMPIILATLCNPTASALDVARVISHEPGIAARVLRVANSPYYGASGSVATLERAFVLLGSDAVRGIAAAACLDRAALRAAKLSPIDLREMLRHCIATATAAEAVARGTSRHLASEAYIAGLLHDFGVIAQLQSDREAFQQMVDGAGTTPGVPVREVERRHRCVSHERCGAVIFSHWNLPRTLVEAVRHHHAPLEAPEAARPLALLVYVGNQLAVGAGLGYAIELDPAPLSDELIAAVGSTRSELDAIAATLPDLTDEMRRLLA